MACSENFNIFVEFIRQKYEEFEELSVERNHFNWKGDETLNFLNNTDLFQSV